MSEPTVEPSEDLTNAVDDALAGLILNEDITLYYTIEALHELSHTLGDALHDLVNTALEALADIEDEPGDLRELLGVTCGALHVAFQHWLKQHDISHVHWWTHHSSGYFLRWSIEAEK